MEVSYHNDTLRVDFGGAESWPNILFVGGAGVDTLEASDTDNVWNITGSGAGYLNSPEVGFASIESLRGGSGNDQFLISAAGRVSGQVLGGSGSDMISFAAKSNAHTVNLRTNFASSTGGFRSIETFIGSTNAAVADVVIGADADTSWIIDSADSGSLYSEPTGQIVFSSFESVTGGTATDIFTFTEGGSLAQRLNGGSAAGVVDTLDLSSRSGGVDFQLSSTNSVVGIIGVYSGIEQIAGNGDSATTVTRVNEISTTWAVNDLGQIVVGGVTYSGVGSIVGGPGVDTLRGPAVDSTWLIDSANAGSLTIPLASVTFSGVENLTGGTASDAFEVLPGGSLTGNLSGGSGPGINSLSYAQWSTAVIVDLSLATPANASHIYGLTRNIQMVTGGSADDTLIGQASRSTILIGLAGNDVLIGGSQRDLLFGGSGADVLLSGSGDDLLIAGTTAYDTNRMEILQIYAEWSSSRSFAQRTANIWGNGSGTRSNGDTFLNNDPLDDISDTVFEDSDVDELNGGTGQDWYFAGLDELTDFIGSGSRPDRLD